MTRLKLGHRVAYAVGDTASNLVFQLSLIYLLFFYTDVAGLSPAAAGIVFIVARIWDAVANPVIGYLVDHTNIKGGAIRFYLRWFPLPLAVLTVLLFTVPPFGADGMFWWALGTYLLWSLLYTLVNLPYAALTAQLSDDSAERTRITTARMIGMLCAVVVVSVATEPLVSMWPKAQAAEGWFWVALSYAALAFVLFAVCLGGTRKIELVPSPPSAYKLRDLARLLGRNGPALIVIGTFFLGASAEYIRESSVVYYVTYNMGDGSLLPVFLGIVVLFMVIGNLLMPVLTDRFEKRGAYLVGVSVAIAASLALQFVSAKDYAIVFFLAAISSLGFSVVATLGWAMLPDTVEYGEKKNGVRGEGLIYAVFGFSQKLATAVGGGVVATVLATSGYQANVAVQKPETLAALTGTLGWIPSVLLLASAIVVWFYPLDKQAFEKLQKELGRRPGATGGT